MNVVLILECHTSITALSYTVLVLIYVNSVNRLCHETKSNLF